jgi:hypothetical protein
MPGLSHRVWSRVLSYSLLLALAFGTLFLFYHYGPEFRRPTMNAKVTGYTSARALLRLHRTEHSLLSDDKKMTIEEYELNRKTQEALIRSGRVVSAALDELAREGIAVLSNSRTGPKFVEEHLRIGFEGEIMVVSFDAGDPRQRAKIINAIVDAYLNVVVNSQFYDEHTRQGQLREQTDRLARELQTLREARERDSQAPTTAGPTANDLVRDDQIEALRQVFREATIRLARLEVDVRQAPRVQLLEHALP